MCFLKVSVFLDDSPHSGQKEILLKIRTSPAVIKCHLLADRGMILTWKCGAMQQGLEFIMILLDFQHHSITELSFFLPSGFNLSWHYTVYVFLITHDLDRYLSFTLSSLSFCPAFAASHCQGSPLSIYRWRVASLQSCGEKEREGTL